MRLGTTLMRAVFGNITEFEVETPENPKVIKSNSTEGTTKTQLIKEAIVSNRQPIASGDTKTVYIIYCEIYMFFRYIVKTYYIFWVSGFIDAIKTYHKKVTDRSNKRIKSLKEEEDEEDDLEDDESRKKFNEKRKSLQMFATPDEKRVIITSLFPLC